MERSGVITFQGGPLTLVGPKSGSGTGSGVYGLRCESCPGQSCGLCRHGQNHQRYSFSRHGL
jgi:hypothetical protein